MMEENVQLKNAMNVMMSVGSHRWEEDGQERRVERKILGSLKATVNCLKDSLNKKDRAKLGYLISFVSRSSSSRQLSSFFKLRRSTVERYRQKAEYQRRKRKDALKSPFKRLVTSFYEDQSYMLGGKRFTSKHRRQKRIMFNISFRAYQRWKIAHNAPSVSFSIFKKLRPQHCVPMANAPHVTGLCEMCINADELLRVLKVIGKDHENQSSFDTRQDVPADKIKLVNSTLSKDLTYVHRVACVQRKCNDCGTHLLQQQLKGLETDSDVKYKYQLWENRRVPKGKLVITKKVLVVHEDKASEIIKKLVAHTGPLASHLFTKDIQHSAFNEAKG